MGRNCRMSNDECRMGSRRRSTFVIRHSTLRFPAFTVLELLTAIALFVVVMGLMVSLARYVRSNSADQLTRAILIDLERDMAQYFTRFDAYPPATMPADEVDEKSLADAIDAANAQLATRLHQPQGGFASDPGAPGLSLRDAWGRAIGYLPGHHPLVGMAPQNRPFFFSAGPDGRYLTRQDNLYSYEQSHPGQSPDPQGHQTRVDKANNPPGGD